jgi:hypothetical protein
MTGPASSPGLARSPITGEAPVAETHGGKTFFEFAWDKLMSGESLSQQALKAFVEPEAYDPSGPFGAALGTVGARLPFARAGELGAGGGKLVTPQGLPIPGKEFTQVAREAAETVKQMPQGAGPLDLTGKMRSDVPQVPVPRYDPPRGISPRLQDAMNNPAVVKGIRESMQAGIKMGAHNWYHNDPIRRAWISELGEKEGSREFARLMDYTAGTSPRSDVPVNIRNASYYYLMTGRELPDKLPYPYGHMAQALHRGNISKLEEAMRGGVGAERMPEYRGWDIFANPKPVSFSEDLQGNLIPVAADTHAMRNLAMRTGDPRWLETQISEAVAKGKKPSEFQREWGEVKFNKDKGIYIVTYRPQELVEGGRMSMKEAKKIPPFWAGKPTKGEYGAVEKFYGDIAKPLKLAPAEGQSAAWSGAGELTGLGTPPNLTFAEMFNNRILYTALIRGEKPENTLRDFIRKRKPLLGFGAAGMIGMEGLKEQLQQ